MKPLRTALQRLRRLARDSSGNTAIIAALVMIPVIVTAGGMAVDLGRLNAARSHAQDLVDAAALQGAASGVTDLSQLRSQARAYVAANLNTRLAEPRGPVEVTLVNGRQVEVSFAGSTPSAFGAFFGVSRMNVDVSAVTERTVEEQIEIALVLDNTWSMDSRDGRGVRKIDALRTSAENLVTTVATAGGNRVRFAVVPYADYVNVGTANRHQPWVSVPADYSTTSTPAPRTCTTSTTRRVCTGGYTTTCQRTVDGVVESYSCTQGQTCSNQTVAPYETCSGGGNPTTTWYRWYGCVGSRRTGQLRLDDTQPAVPYPGYLSTSQNCLNPIVPLTSNSQSVISSIRGLVVNIGGYKPSTYIPAGMIWGVNMLSPTAPFTEGAAYDAENRRPRKVLVLMTDGANTLRFQANDGRHVSPQNANQLRGVDADVEAICRYARGNNIEIYTVALAVNSTSARNMLRNCASRTENYFDAADTQQLADAFAAIAASINRVRLVR